MKIKPKGVSVNLWIDGIYAGNDCATCQCDHVDTQWQCPFALGYVMPMEEGARCQFKDGADCHNVHAKIDALKSAITLAKRELKKFEDEIEG